MLIARTAKTLASRSPRRRSPPRDAPRGPRGYHQQHSGYRSRSRSRDRARSRGREPRGGGYYDRDAPRSRSGSRDREWYGGPASRDVIIEGLGPEMDDEYIINELRHELHVEGIEKVAVIRERKTGISRQFAFIHFTTVQQSRAFLEQYYPTVSLGPSADRCRIAFSRERDESDRRSRRRDDEEEWKCRVCLLVNYPRRQECFRCQTPKSELSVTGTLTHPTPTHFTNDGERDMAASPPSQFLLFRNLESSVNEELLAKGALKLTIPNSETPETSKTGPIGAKESSLKRILLVRDRKTNESWRYGFAEFSTASDAQAALAAYTKVEKFTISSKPVTVSYIHPGVFVPVYNAPKGADKFTFTAMSAHVGNGLRLAYWDDDGFVSEHTVSKPEETSVGSDDAIKERQKGIKEGSEEKGKGKKKKLDKEVIGAAVPVTKKSVPAHLQFWQNRHSELHGIPTQVQENKGDNESTSGSENNGSGLSTKKRKAEDQPDETQAPQSFADLKKLACLLCSRQFKTAEKIYEHERVSNLHLQNLRDPKLRETAMRKLTKAGIVSTPNDTAEYRDRAKERRQVFGKSTAPQSSSKKKKKEGPELEPEPALPSRGAALLGKMGWTSGQGLGASGDGRTEHVIAEMYTQGVGLGMKGAKVGDVEEVAKGGGGGYNDFVKRTKEKAKERYEGMQ
ncbi:unnamed protein product [Tuber melanosporum]|uniref:(Perigord truffle) hypothetical protein n=1 Tax=Tuber melanosporum (strain Mel28) TaxID=656061 RepID=D5GIS6_TUBMM|nr:uncharacterized protein GSTUM_00008647001 [Tuber melanosporum]CAZ84419.1 unnamed protein product [Tuber melanosporum]